MRFSTIVALLCVVQLSQATLYYYTTANGSNGEWISRMRSGLSAGDTLRFAAGTYNIASGQKLGCTWNGQSNARIIIEGENGAKIYRNGAGQNNLDLATGSYFTLRNLEFEGGSRGLRLGEAGPVSYGNFENLKIHDTETTAISANQGGMTYSYLTFRNNEVYNVGTGASASECFYLGCNDYQPCTFYNGIVDNNYCHNSNTDTGALQVKTSSYNMIITNNVVVDSTSAGILTYDDYDKGVNLIQGNYVARVADNGIQITAGSRCYNNIVVASGASGIRVQANQVQSGKQIRNVWIMHNTVVHEGSGAAVRVDSRDSGSGTDMKLVNNVAFSANTDSYSYPYSGSIKNGYNRGTLAGTGNFQVGSIADELVAGAYYPKDGSSLVGAGDASTVNIVTTDFNCRARTSPVNVGAYQTKGTNSGWTVQNGFKTCSAGGATTGLAGTTTAGCIADSSGSALPLPSSGPSNTTETEISSSPAVLVSVLLSFVALLL